MRLKFELHNYGIIIGNRTTMEDLERTVILEVTQEHQKDLQKYILKDVKEISAIDQDKDSTEREGNTNKGGAYGNLIDLE